MGRVWKIVIGFSLGVAVTLVTGQIQSTQSGLLCMSPVGSCQATKWYGFPLAWRSLVSYTYPPGCTGPLERESCILQLYYPQPSYDVITFLLDTVFYATFGYGLILFAAPSCHYLDARLRSWAPSRNQKWTAPIPTG